MVLKDFRAVLQKGMVSGIGRVFFTGVSVRVYQRVRSFIVGLPRPYGLGINITIAFTTAS